MRGGSRNQRHDIRAKPQKRKRLDVKLSGRLREGYKGFCPLETNPNGDISGGGGHVTRMHWNDLNPQQFFSRYVSVRKPLVISTDGISGGALSVFFGLQGESAKWALPGSHGMKEMRRKAADCEVVVERKPEQSSLFGQSDDTNREKTTFGKFCEELENGNESGYLTTQALEDNDGCPKSLAADYVLKLLSDCQSLRPNLMGNLTPVQYNMWFGRSSTGSSSGLHHDFHDNIYILLRGRKEFRLFSPRCLDLLAPAGVRQAQLHANGLISYVPGLRDDGAPFDAVQDWRLRDEKVRHSVRAVSAVSAHPENDSSQDEEDELEQMLNDAVNDTEASGSETGGNKDAKASLPDSFCQVSTVSSSKPIPKLLEGRHVTAELGVGDVLYLPASWFHEVISYGPDIGGHLALNIWMAPPHWGSTLHAPYEDGFWESFYKKLDPRDQVPLPDSTTPTQLDNNDGSHSQQRLPVRAKVPSKRLPFTHTARLHGLKTRKKKPGFVLPASWLQLICRWRCEKRENNDPSSCKLFLLLQNRVEPWAKIVFGICIHTMKIISKN